MLLDIIRDIIVLFGLGLAGWLIMSRIRMPASEMIGPVALIGTLRAFQVELPTSPDFLFPAAQIIIGIFVGSMLNRNTVRELKPMAVSAVIIIVWALSIVFLIGFFLARYSAMDLYTAMLSASMGGLPEITVIALASGAGVTVIIVMHMIRMLGTILIFPFLLKWFEKRETRRSNKPPKNQCNNSSDLVKNGINLDSITFPRMTGLFGNLSSKYFNQKALSHMMFSFRESWFRILITLLIASMGGLLIEWLGVPAGLLVGSTIFVAAISVAGVQVSKLSPRLLDLLLVFIGITVADNISLQTITTMINPDFLVPILIATAVIFATSFGTAWIIYRVTGWDFLTSFLAAAPGGFTVMTALAIKYGRDPFKVSMLHLCRFLSINIFVPFLFMFMMR